MRGLDLVEKFSTSSNSSNQIHVRVPKKAQWQKTLVCQVFSKGVVEKNSRKLTGNFDCLAMKKKCEWHQVAPNFTKYFQELVLGSGAWNKTWSTLWTQPSASKLLFQFTCSDLEISAPELLDCPPHTRPGDLSGGQTKGIAQRFHLTSLDGQGTAFMNSKIFLMRSSWS